jgi:hypothetical protein
VADREEAVPGLLGSTRAAKVPVHDTADFLPSTQL